MIRDFLITMNLPDWARWYAVDSDGEVCVFEYMPTRVDRRYGYQWSGWNNEIGNAQRILTIADMAGIDWTRTLHEIDRAG